MEGESTEELSHWQLLHLIASQFDRALAPDTLLGIVGEGAETVNFLEDAKVEPSTLDVLEA